MTEGRTKKENRGFLIVLAVVAFALLGGWFYWFQWRPSNIRMTCYRETIGRNDNWIKSNSDGDKEWKPDKEWMANPQQAKNAEWGWWYPISALGAELKYDKCLLSKGLKSETPLTSLIKSKLEGK